MLSAWGQQLCMFLTHTVEPSGPHAGESILPLSDVVVLVSTGKKVCCQDAGVPVVQYVPFLCHQEFML
jgi:hypothetical protein